MNRHRSPLPRLVLVMMLAKLLVLMPVAASAQSGTPQVSWDRAFSSIRLNTQAASLDEIRYLQPTGDPALWDLAQRLPDKSMQIVASFRQHRAVAVDPLPDATLERLMAEKGILRFDRQLVMGTKITPDGVEQAIGALRVEVEALDTDGQRTSETVLVSLLEAPDVGRLEQLADRFAAAMQGRHDRELFGSKEPPEAAEKSTCIFYCSMDHLDTLDRNELRASNCISRVQVGVAACLLACVATGRLAIPCSVICGVGGVLAILDCLLDKEERDAAADRQLRSCLDGCEYEPAYYF